MEVKELKEETLVLYYFIKAAEYRDDNG